MKKYIATCIDDDWISHYGEGDTPDEAFNDFMEGDFSFYCAYAEIPVGEACGVYIYTHIPVENSDWEVEELDPGIKFILDKLIETRRAESV